MTTQTPQSFGTEANAPVRERAGQVGGTAKDEAAGVAQEVKYQARDLVGEARSQVRQQVDTQRGRLSELLRDMGEELEQMADRSDRNGIASELARQAAQRTQDVRGYLDGGGDVVEDVRRFARRRPGTFLLGAVAAGVLAGRATRAATAAKRRQQGAGPDERGYPAGSYPAGSYPAGSYAGAGYPSDTYATGSYGAGSYAATDYPAGTASGTPSAAPASGYGTPPTTSVPTSTDYGTTPAAYSATEYQERLPAEDEPGTAPAEYPTTTPTGSTSALPPEREER
jgi:uncharacterized protein YjbJ (UPF0337 family)